MFTAQKVNDQFFDKIDVEEKAYLLGYFMSDGHLSSQKKNKEYNHMSISLSLKDIEILEYFQKYICQNAKIQKRQSKSFWKEKYTVYDICKIQWTSLYMGNILNKKYSITNNKSIDNTLDFPDMEKDVIRHFVRGFMDGDGTVRKTKSYPTINFVCTSEKFIKKLEQELLNNVGGSTYLVLDTKNRKTPLWRLYLFSYSKSNHPGNNILAKKVREDFYKNLYNYLYKDSNLFLKRKKERFDKIPC